MLKFALQTPAASELPTGMATRVTAGNEAGVPTVHVAVVIGFCASGEVEYRVPVGKLFGGIPARLVPVGTGAMMNTFVLFATGAFVRVTEVALRAPVLQRFHT
jgi:hypothetical protein